MEKKSKLIFNVPIFTLQGAQLSSTFFKNQLSKIKTSKNLKRIKLNKKLNNLTIYEHTLQQKREEKYFIFIVNK
ncbi:hypothetical protein DOY81_006039 [Sarcophaga bullata]|nr:hypothetical protein DOY81_006039 [Sarcophaga bullata]